MSRTEISEKKCCPTLCGSKGIVWWTVNAHLSSTRPLESSRKCALSLQNHSRGEPFSWKFLAYSWGVGDKRTRSVLASLNKPGMKDRLCPVM
jgi:hypothetical protein